MSLLGVRKTGRFELAATIALEDGVGAWVVVGAADPDAEAALLAMELSAQLSADVGVVLKPEGEQLALLGYNFERVFADGHVEFIRFDLNPVGHANEARELRAHMHPGHDG